MTEPRWPLAARLAALGVTAAVVAAGCAGGDTPETIAKQTAAVAADLDAPLPVPATLGIDPCRTVSAEAAARALGAEVRAGVARGTTIGTPANDETVPAGSCVFVAAATREVGADDRVQIRIGRDEAGRIFERLRPRLDEQSDLSSPALWQPDAQTIWLHHEPFTVSIQVLRSDRVVDRAAVASLAASVESRLEQP